MSISFSNSLPEIFEYPSYDSPVVIPAVANPTPIKPANIGSYGKKLGSSWFRVFSQPDRFVKQPARLPDRKPAERVGGLGA